VARLGVDGNEVLHGPAFTAGDLIELAVLLRVRRSVLCAGQQERVAVHELGERALEHARALAEGADGGVQVARRSEHELGALRGRERAQRA
jgi:hypothetical protein